MVSPRRMTTVQSPKMTAPYPPSDLRMVTIQSGSISFFPNLDDVLDAALAEVEARDQAGGDRDEALVQVRRAEVEADVPHHDLEVEEGRGVTHDLVGLVPVSDLGDPVLGLNLVLRLLHGELARGEVGGHLVVIRAGRQLRLVGGE